MNPGSIGSYCQQSVGARRQRKVSSPCFSGSINSKQLRSHDKINASVCQCSPSILIKHHLHSSSAFSHIKLSPSLNFKFWQRFESHFGTNSHKLYWFIPGMPLEVYGTWYPFAYPFNQVACIITGLLSETATNATVLTITSFTVERYIAICHPFR